MFVDNLCDVCGENEHKTTVKATCSHLVKLCDDCYAGERRRVMHEKCGVCTGKLSDAHRGAQIEAENEGFGPRRCDVCGACPRTHACDEEACEPKS